VEDPSFATVVGLALWGSKFTTNFGNFDFGQKISGLLETQSMVKLKKWFKSFLP
jgi:hypothetical protein